MPYEALDTWKDKPVSIPSKQTNLFHISQPRSSPSARLGTFQRAGGSLECQPATMTKERRSSPDSGFSMKKRKVLILTCLAGFIVGIGVAILMAERPTERVEGATASVSKQRERDLIDTVEKLRSQVKSMQEEMDRKAAEHAKYRETKTEDNQVLVDTGKDCKGNRHKVWTPSSKRDEKDPELGKLLRKISTGDEILIAVSNINYAQKGGMLDLWIDGVKRAGVENALVVALDDETKRNVEERGIHAFRMDMEIPDSQKNNGGNHAVSALKFRILARFMNLGYSVLLSDVDVLTLDNPFKHLVRDSDVESMSDGWDERTAYGYNDVFDDPSMGWSRYAHTMRIFVFNSGLFYIRPSEASMELLIKLTHRLETEGGWDQALFNECIFFPNSPRNKVRFLLHMCPQRSVDLCI